jgi:DHA1 family bicyclomycin/chloramphenicol resistance-like MFS transporter
LTALPSHRRLALILGGLAAMGPLAIDTYLPAFPVIAQALGTDAAHMQGTLAAYFAGLALGQAAMGPMTDRFGRRWPLLAGLTLFALASLGCALATSVEQLTLLRFAQSLGGCAGMVISRAVVRDVAQEQAAVRLMARLMLVMGLAPILAPLLGGWLLSAFGWRGIFATLAAYAAAMSCVVWFLLPETLPVERRRRDSMMGILRVYGQLLADRRFMGPALAGALPLGGMFAYIASSPFVMMEVHGLTPTVYAMVFGANAAGLIVMSQVNAWATRHLPPARLLRIALLVPLAGAVLLLIGAVMGPGLGFAFLLPGLALSIAALGAILPLSAAIAMQPHGRVAGSASALLGTLQFSLGAVAGALTGVLHDGTALPMAIVVACGSVGGFLAYRMLR